MKKLEDIPKKQVFNVPDGYFEELPGIIQSRVARQSKRETSPVTGYALRYALGAAVIGVAAFFWLNRPGEKASPESILASIETQELVAYISEADVTTDELLDDVILDHEDADEIEGSVYGLDLDESGFDAIMNEID